MNRRFLHWVSEKEWYYGDQSSEDNIQNGIGLKKERDGSLYYGMWKDGLRDGTGVLCKSDGSLTAGRWENDKSFDVLLQIYPAGSVQAMFCGKSERGRPVEGTLFCSDGKLYHGFFSEWQKENFNGEGALMWPDKRIYAGRWKKGGTDIGGVIRRADGRMTGTLNNVRNGYREKCWQEDAEKLFFYGMTDDDEVRNANGILFYAGGGFFAGTMRGGQKNGFGVCRNADGSICIGEWNPGGMQGDGIRVCLSGDSVDVYAGEFKNNLCDGEGCSFCRTRGEWDFGYSGTWKDGKKSGAGILNLNDGKVYVGEFAGDKRNGEGETIDSDGTHNAMNWKMGVPDVLLEQVNGPGPSCSQHGFLVGIRADEDAPYQRMMRIEPGCDYEVRILYHNDADTADGSEEGTTTENRLRAHFTKTVCPGKNGVVSVSISSVGTRIPVIWDGIEIQAEEEINICYKIASAKIFNGWIREGRILPQTLFTENGVYLGTDELNGVLPPGSNGYVTFVIHASGRRSKDSVSFDPRKALQKEYGKSRKRSRIFISITASVGNGRYEKSVRADIGEEISAKIVFTNSASNQDIIISAALPSAIELIDESSVLALSDGSRRKLPDDWVKDGLRLSNFFAEGKGEIQFRLRFFPDASAFSDDMKVEAMIETADIAMRGVLLIAER